jgi:26S proteasome regulatory subunit N5
MIQYALHGSEYLDVAKYYHKIWETPSIKEDTSKGREVRTTYHGADTNLTLSMKALEYVVYYVILAPHNNEQSDMLHRVFNYPELAKFELH